MNSKDEALSLRDNPLPPEQITSMPGDELLPSRILQADGHIGSLERALSLAREAAGDRKYHEMREGMD